MTAADDHDHDHDNLYQLILSTMRNVYHTVPVEAICKLAGGMALSALVSSR